VDARDLERERQALIERHGPWTHHNVRLGDGARTLGPDPQPRHARRLERLVQTVADVCPRPIAELRVLDLACHEGLNALEFGAQGAEVVAIEVREASLAKADFAKRALGLERVEFVRDDVRNLRVDRHGRFDVVLCLGILYHLDTPDVFELLARIAEVCAHVALIDTNVSVAADELRVWRGRSYAGRRYFEHDPASAAEERERLLKRSIDNPEAFWLTRASLLNALADVGFSSVHECLNPGVRTRRDRPTLMAFKGQAQSLRVVPDAEQLRPWRWSQGEDEGVHPNQRRLYRLGVRYPRVRRAVGRVPTPVRPGCAG
jgi:hypothetical protein